MILNNSKESLIWLINNPNKKLYTKYYDFVILSHTGNQIEFHNWKLDDLNQPIWDYDLYNFSDFLESFDNMEFNTENVI